jgi:hypothetical protein
MSKRARALRRRMRLVLEEDALEVLRDAEEGAQLGEGEGCLILREELEDGLAREEARGDDAVVSKPFVKFVDGKLSLVAELDDTLLRNARVVSILGKARMGKSTFLNTIISHLSGENISVFKAQNTYEHCTKGIDYYYLPSHNILLLDSQGLDSQDSSHEPALLLFVYLVSDLIIFNEIRMLQNGALKLMEPICTFMTYVDIEEIVKPKLTFRIADSSTLSGTPEENIKMIIDTVYDDQYQSIRESIRHLFNPDINLIKTDNLDKNTVKMLEENDYIRLLSEGDCGFQEAIDKVIASLPDCNREPINYMLKIPQIIEQINTNEKIKIEKLDIVGMTVRDEINTWKEGLSPTLFSTIEVDGTQKCYDERVESRKAMKKITLTAFTKKFKSVPDKIRESEKVKLAARLSTQIQFAEEESVAKAEERVKSYIQAAQTDRTLHEITASTASFSTWSKVNFDAYLVTFITLENAVEALYNPVKEKYKNWCKSVYDKFYEGFNKVLEYEIQQKEKMQQICDEAYVKFIETKVYQIKKLEKFHNASILLVNNARILEGWILEAIELLKINLQPIANTRYKMIVTMKNGSLSTDIQEFNTRLDSNVFFIHYDLVKGIFDTFCKNINTLRVYQDSVIYLALVKRKEEMLCNKLIDISLPGQSDFITTNPEITFITDTILGQFIKPGVHPTSLSVTMKTYTQVYAPLLKNAKDKMITKGYCNEEDTFGIIESVMDPPYKNRILKQIKAYPQTDKHIQSQLFIHTLLKLYCQELQKGNVLVVP